MAKTTLKFCLIACCGFVHWSLGRARSIHSPAALRGAAPARASNAAAASVGAGTGATKTDPINAATIPTRETRYEWMNLAATCRRQGTGMVFEIQKYFPSRENADDAVPLMQPQTIANAAITRIKTVVWPDSAAFMRTPSGLSSLVRTLAMRSAGTRTPTRT